MTAFSGKSVIVTGASRGIGAATARAFARDGAKVMLSARSGAAIETIAAEVVADGGVAEAQRCDVADWADVSKLVAKTNAAFGGVDFLINNAGVIDPISPLASSDPNAWAHAADINFKGVYFGMRAVLPIMKQGVIVNISSGAATSPLEGWSHYCSSKAAAAMLTRCADREAPEGVRVVGLSPGTVATEMQVKIKASGVNPVSQLDPSVHIPAEWVARAILWLCSEDAVAFRGEDVSLRDEDIRKRIGLV